MRSVAVVVSTVPGFFEPGTKRIFRVKHPHCAQAIGNLTENMQPKLDDPSSVNLATEMRVQDTCAAGATALEYVDTREFYRSNQSIGNFRI